MSKRLVSLLVVVVALVFGLASSALAEEPANVAGKWEMTSEGRQGPMTQTLTIEQKGETIKGTIQSPRGETPFEGTVKGNKISFTVKRTRPDGVEMVIEYTGTVEGDSMKGTSKVGEFTREWTAKRQK